MEGTPKTIKFNGTNLGKMGQWNTKIQQVGWFPEILLIKLQTNSIFWTENILPSYMNKLTSLVDIPRRRSYNSLNGVETISKVLQI